MTVRKLIAYLENMPQEAEINLEIIGFHGMEHNCSVDNAHIEVYENTDNRVCIQAIEQSRLTHYKATYTKDIRRAQVRVGAFYPYLRSGRGRSARPALRNCEQIVNYLFPNCKCFMNESRPIIHILFTKSS